MIPSCDAVATYPVTVHLPRGQEQAKAGSWAELFVSVAHPQAEQAVITAAVNWSSYLRNYCGLELGPVALEHTSRGGTPVILGRTVLRQATRPAGTVE